MTDFYTLPAGSISPRDRTRGTWIGRTSHDVRVRGYLLWRRLHGEHPITMLRFLFALPEPVGVPDGLTVTEPVPDDPQQRRHDDPMVSVTFRQATVQSSRAWAAQRAVFKIVREEAGLPSVGDMPQTDLESAFTVVDASTAARSPDAVPPEDASNPQRYKPRADPLTRILRVVNEVVSTYRVATESLIGDAAYVRIQQPVLMYQARALDPPPSDAGTTDAVVQSARLIEPWQGPSLVMLDHTNWSDPFPGEHNDEFAELFLHWYKHRGNPLGLWRERFIEARRALHVNGQTAQAVLSANTSVEILVDVTLALLLWEDGKSPREIAGKFHEGQARKRLAGDLPQLLKGNWNTHDARSPVAVWERDANRLRHRVIHGGYRPTWAEAEDALAATHDLHTHIFDQIAKQRNRYKRAALMTLGSDGLIQRDLWKGQIKRFAEEEADTESPWRPAFSTFWTELTDAMLADRQPR